MNPYFEGLPEAHGYACELGAWDGQYFSATLELEERGWTVLCIEPNPEVEEIGRQRRKLWRQVACGPADLDDQVFWSIGGASNSALRLPDNTTPYGAGAGIEHRVSVRRLDRVLEEAGFPRLDVLSLDVEGYEQEVLEGFTVERWKPKIMFIERYGPKINRILSFPGYEQVGRYHEDDVFKRTE